ncbi:unnamed protein product, partial [marine sediment metagenome]
QCKYWVNVFTNSVENELGEFIDNSTKQNGVDVHWII